MTEADYYAAVKRLGLRPTQFPEIYSTSHGEAYSVPLAEPQNERQRKETIEQIKKLLGVGNRHDDD